MLQRWREKHRWTAAYAKHAPFLPNLCSPRQGKKTPKYGIHLVNIRVSQFRRSKWDYQEEQMWVTLCSSCALSAHSSQVTLYSYCNSVNDQPVWPTGFTELTVSLGRVKKRVNVPGSPSLQWERRPSMRVQWTHGAQLVLHLWVLTCAHWCAGLRSAA